MALSSVYIYREMDWKRKRDRSNEMFIVEEEFHEKEDSNHHSSIFAPNFIG